jgi:hypothetical protein
MLQVDLRFRHLCTVTWHGDYAFEQVLSKIQHSSYKINTYLTPVNTAVYGRKLTGSTGPSSPTAGLRVLQPLSDLGTGAV